MGLLNSFIVFLSSLHLSPPPPTSTHRQKEQQEKTHSSKRCSLCPHQKRDPFPCLRPEQKKDFSSSVSISLVIFSLPFFEKIGPSLPPPLLINNLAGRAVN